MKIIFFPHKNRTNKNNEMPIYCRITIDGDRAEFSINTFVDANKWKPGKQTDTLLCMKLDMIKQKLSAIHLDLELKDIAVNASIVKALYLKKQTAGQINKITLTTCFDNFLRDQELNGVRWSTLKTYPQRLKILLSFIDKCYHKKNIFMDEIDIAFMEKFNGCLMGRNFSNSYKNLLLKTVKLLLNYCVRKGYLERNKAQYYRLKEFKKAIVTLSIDELKQIEDLVVENDALKNVKDCFLFQCYTGIANVDLYQDFRKVVYASGQLEYLKFCRRKTNIECIIPVLQKAKELLQKHNYLLPVITNQKYNAALKIIGDRAKIRISLTTHLGRKTCGQLMLDSGISLEVIAKIFGHSTTKITQSIYCGINEKRIELELYKQNLIA